MGHTNVGGWRKWHRTVDAQRNVGGWAYSGSRDSPGTSTGEACPAAGPRFRPTTKLALPPIAFRPFSRRPARAYRGGFPAGPLRGVAQRATTDHSRPSTPSASAASELAHVGPPAMAHGIGPRVYMPHIARPIAPISQKPRPPPVTPRPSGPLPARQRPR